MGYLGTKPNIATSLQDNIVTSDKINDGAIQTTDIANSAVTTTKIADANVTVAKLSATGTPSSSNFLRGDGSWQAPSGKLLQVLSTTKTDVFTMASATFADITGLSLTITPSSTSSKILIIANVTHVGTSGTSSSGIRLVRDSTAISIGDAAGSRSRTSGGANYSDAGTRLTGDSIMFLDSPATTSATTYKIQIKAYSSTAYVNRSSGDIDDQAYYRGVSSITVMEIAA